MSDGEPLIALRGVTKDYRGLRPLRVANLELRRGRSLALLGFDLPMAEVLVNLITGAHLPDTGDVTVFGRSTRDLKTSEDWVAALDQFGLISDRAILVERFTVEQNLAMPLSLEIEDMSPSLRRQVRELADEVSLPADELASPTGALSDASKLRLRLGRALALGPRVLLAEHPNAMIAPADVRSFAADLARIIAARRIGSIVLTADRTFAAAVADEVLSLEPATGVLKSMSGWRRWFG
jgi:ABC-type transporter Mla maintaining outer membrane lipid asymmetry ATPase subunit MlaF